jgi:hypothetical protein
MKARAKDQESAVSVNKWTVTKNEDMRRLNLVCHDSRASTERMDVSLAGPLAGLHLDWAPSWVSDYWASP